MADGVSVIDAQPWMSKVFSGWWVRVGGYRHDPARELDIQDMIVADFVPCGADGTDFLLVDADQVSSARNAPARLLEAIGRADG